MSDIRLQNVALLHLLWIIPVLATVILYGWRKQRHALTQFIDSGLLDRISISINWTRRRAKALILLSGVALVIFALTRPGWNPKPKTVERYGRDVVFVLDVSRSMLAEDLAPNRLDRAKLAILDCLERIEGDRVGLIAFAGTAAVKCPLTMEYGFFRLMLEDLSTDSIARGGTMIGDALRKTLDEVFDNQEKQFKDVILITDGEDHDSFPIEAAKQLGERGVRLIAIGLGDENEGRRIPITDKQTRRKTFLQYKGKEIWSKLDADTLRRMVNATTGGKYLNVSTGTIDLGQVYTQLIASAEKAKLESETIERYEEKFQIFLGFAFLLFGFEWITHERRRKP